MRASLTLLSIVIPGLQSAAAVCPSAEINPGGVKETRFFPVPAERIREAVSDAMQAVGALLLVNSRTAIRGERVSARSRDTGLPRGNEVISAEITPTEQNGVAGTLVRIETLRPGSKPGSPKQSWSATVLNETGCLLELLSIQDPAKASLERKPGIPTTAGTHDVVLPSGTPITLRLRRFISSAEVRDNQPLTLEVASDIAIGEYTVIRRGALGMARFKGVHDSAGGHAGKRAGATIEFETVYLVTGDRIPLSGELKLENGALFRMKMDITQPPIASWAWFRGKDFGLRAGTPLVAVTDKDQKLQIQGETRF